MTPLRRVIHIVAIVLNALWTARIAWGVWGLLPPWQRILLTNPFGPGHGWIVLNALLTPTLAVVALVWSFRWNDQLLSKG